MSNITTYLNNNIGWIKDICTILFTGIASTIAILTYRRAKATILQPKRTEIIKIQIQILTDFLKFISNDGHNIDTAIDYYNVFRYNLYLTLRSEELMNIDVDSDLYIEMNNNIAGWYDYSDKSLTGFEMIKGNLYEFDLLYSNVKNNRTIIITKRSWQFILNLKDKSTNPFLTNDIVKILDGIGENMAHNFFNVIPQVIEYEIFNIDTKKDYSIKSSVKRFENLRFKHAEDIKKLRMMIRKHLSIDDKW
ncbi:hypothetical protein KJK34_02220 [Flavobacterium sp. D11R37]|uniref:hypothetical protein n=1 Tax=Flavobacterium coralii TaxID=2838017 RepID=UPI001CA77295|nr:hypothetical protein [Flavobacterium coralii]MBY8961559.1 hypothetical protein [Flavobacterium coralii]